MNVVQKSDSSDLMAEFRKDIDAQIADVMPATWEGHQRLEEEDY